MLYDFYECEECGLPWHRAELRDENCPECGGHCIQDDQVYYEPQSSYNANDGTEGSN